MRNKILQIAKEELENNREALESLRDYDMGLKDIDISKIERIYEETVHN